ncbi:MAG: polysaccharide biosynthesis protein [Lachnospiraceae bacterium]|nr:polysaccharide biosynthesis protein [Lachnospiraceae bacterium]
MSENRKSDTAFILQGSILAIASIVSRIVGLVYRIPLTAIIGKTGNDYYGTAYEIYNILLIISSYSIPLAVSKLVAARMAEGQAKNAMKVLKGSLAFAALTGGTAAVVVYFLADVFANILKTPMCALALRVLAPVLFIVAIVGVLRGFFQGLHTMIPTAISQIAEQVLNAIVSVFAAYTLVRYGERVGAVLGQKEIYRAAYGAAGGTLGTAIGSLTALIFMCVIMMLYMKRLKKKMRRDHTKSVLEYKALFRLLIFTIVPVLLSTTLYNISSIIDTGIFKNIVHLQGYDAKEVSEWWGVYTGQYRVLINVPISIASAMAASSVPALTAAFQSKEKLRVQRQITSATRFVMVIAIPCAMGLFVLAKPVMMLLFNDPDETSAAMLRVGAIAVVFYALSTLSNGLLQGINRMKIPVKNAAIALVAQALVLVLLLFAFHLNIYAVVLANTFYAALMCVLNGLAVIRYSGAKQDFAKTYVIPFLASCVMGLSVYVSYELIELIIHSNAISTAISIIVGVIVYFVVLLLMHGISENELRRFPKGALLVQIAKKMQLL